MIPEETIARIRGSVNLVELVREHVPSLKKRGRNWLARCPFHQEKTPSFNVNPEMGLFKCFGCGVGGDAFKFLMLTENLNYPEAIRKIAARVGVTIEEEQREAVSVDAQEKQTLYALLEEAARFYHRHLMESPEGAAVRDYLSRRGLKDESLVKFAIGFAPPSGSALREAATRKGHALEMLEKAGLLRRREPRPSPGRDSAGEVGLPAKGRGEGNRFSDYFWNRIVFPIWDVQGRIVAFGGRARGDALPKYVNSPDTPVYSKSRHLYGLYQGLASFRKERHAVILEGYMDVVTCHQYGLEVTAATLGTALTEDHVRLLRRYSDRITLLFDPDAAGAQATLRGGELLLADGFAVDVVTLPDELDPDEILVRDGREALDRQLMNAVPFIDYAIAASLRKHPGLSPENKLSVAKEILPVLQTMPDPLIRDEYLARLANALRADKGVLAQQMKRLKRDSSAPVLTVSGQDSLQEGRRGMLTIEEEMITLALLCPSEEAAELLDGVSWLDARCQAVWSRLRTWKTPGALQLSEVLASLPEDVQQWALPLALQQRSYKRPLEVLRDLLQAWQKQDASRQWRALKPEIDSMIEGRIPSDTQKIQMYNELSKRLKGSPPQTAEASFHG